MTGGFRPKAIAHGRIPFPSHDQLTPICLPMGCLPHSNHIRNLMLLAHAAETTVEQDKRELVLILVYYVVLYNGWMAEQFLGLSSPQLADMVACASAAPWSRDQVQVVFAIGCNV